MSEEDIEEMFTYADKDGDGKISYTEFQIMINPPKPPEPPRPTLADLAKKTKIEESVADIVVGSESSGDVKCSGALALSSLVKSLKSKVKK